MTRLSAEVTRRESSAIDRCAYEATLDPRHGRRGLDDSTAVAFDRDPSPGLHTPEPAPPVRKAHPTSPAIDQALCSALRPPQDRLTSTQPMMIKRWPSCVRDRDTTRSRPMAGVLVEGDPGYVSRGVTPPLILQGW